MFASPLSQTKRTLSFSKTGIIVHKRSSLLDSPPRKLTRMHELLRIRSYYGRSISAPKIGKCCAAIGKYCSFIVNLPKKAALRCSLPPHPGRARTNMTRTLCACLFLSSLQDPEACAASLSEHLAHNLPHHDQQQEAFSGESETNREAQGGAEASGGPAIVVPRRGILTQGSTFITDTSASAEVTKLR